MAILGGAPRAATRPKHIDSQNDSIFHISIAMSVDLTDPRASNNKLADGIKTAG